MIFLSCIALEKLNDTNIKINTEDGRLAAVQNRKNVELNLRRLRKCFVAKRYFATSPKEVLRYPVIPYEVQKVPQMLDKSVLKRRNENSFNTR